MDTLDRFTRLRKRYGTIKTGIGQPGRRRDCAGAVPSFNHEPLEKIGWLFAWGETMGMTLVKITMPTTAAGKLIDWEDCVQDYHEKEKQKWQHKLEAQRTGISARLKAAGH